jgi:hypothetical protein
LSELLHHLEVQDPTDLRAGAAVIARVHVPVRVVHVLAPEEADKKIFFLFKNLFHF